MAELKDVIAYLMRDYPNPDALANARVTKMVYLADWKAALDHGEQLTRIRWFFDNFGPYVHDVRNVVAKHSELFRIEQRPTDLGGQKNVFVLRDPTYDPQLSSRDKAILNHVRSKTESLSFDSFVKLVYSTYPVMKSDRYEFLNLAKLAQQRNAERDGG